MGYEVYKDAKDEWRWRLRASNHEIIAVSSEGYRQRVDALRAIELVKGSSAASVKFEGDSDEE